MWYTVPMDKTTIYIPVELHAKVKAIARRSGRTQAQVIREALATYVTQQEPLLPRTIGIVSSGKVRGADVDEWLAENWKRDW
jgi:metal-responsive CopG/Arc/MetJ family transcriptional regulator